MTTAAHPRPVRILILGTGSMAKSHVEAYAAVPGAEVVAGVDSRPEVLAELLLKEMSTMRLLVPLKANGALSVKVFQPVAETVWLDE